jgi:hypothetical protein
MFADIEAVETIYAAGVVDCGSFTCDLDGLSLAAAFAQAAVYALVSLHAGLKPRKA